MSAKTRKVRFWKERAYDALFELATSYRINYMFDEARECFIRYSETLLPDDHDNLDFIRIELAVCDNAPLLMDDPVSFTEENLDLHSILQILSIPLISADGKSLPI